MHCGQPNSALLCFLPFFPEEYVSSNTCVQPFPFFKIIQTIFGFFQEIDFLIFTWVSVSLSIFLNTLCKTLSSTVQCLIFVLILRISSKSVLYWYCLQSACDWRSAYFFPLLSACLLSCFNNDFPSQWYGNDLVLTEIQQLNFLQNQRGPPIQFFVGYIWWLWGSTSCSTDCYVDPQIKYFVLWGF